MVFNNIKKTKTMVKKKIKGKDMVKKRKKVKEEKRLKNKKMPLHQNALFISFSFIYFFKLTKGLTWFN